MRIYLEAIDELNKYKKGEIIPDAEFPIYLFPLPLSLQESIDPACSDLFITRRSLAHILQKGHIGMTLAHKLHTCIYESDEIYLSDKGTKDAKRHLLLKHNAVDERTAGVVIEINPQNNFSLVITAMIADVAYTSRKFKRLG